MVKEDFSDAINARRHPHISAQRRIWIWLIVAEVLMAMSIFILPRIYVFFLMTTIPMLALFFWKPILGLAFLIPFLPNYPIIFMSIGAADISLLEPFLFWAFFCWVLLVVRDKELKIYGSRIDIAIFFLFSWCLFSLFWTISVPRGLFQILRIMEGLVIYYLHIHLVRDKKDFNFLLWSWVAAGIFFSIVGFYEAVIYGFGAAQQLVIQETYTHLTRAVRTSAFFTGPDALGFLLALAIILTIITYVTTASKKLKCFLMICLPFIFFVFLTTFSRKSFLGVFLAMIYLSWRNKKAFKTILSVSVIGLLLLLILGSGGFLVAFWNRLQSYFMPLEVAAKHRTVAWRIAWDLFTKSPVFGQGIGSFYIMAQRLESPLNLVHNFFLYIMCELGLVGLILLLFWGIQIFRSFIAFSKRNVDGSAYAISVGLVCGFIIIVIQGMFRTIGLTDAIFWGFLGLASAFLRVYTPSRIQPHNIRLPVGEATVREKKCPK